MILKQKTIELLEDIERRIVPEEEDAYAKLWDDFVNHKFTGSLFDPKKANAHKANYEYQDVNINDAIEDYETMLVDQMQGVSRSLENGKNFLAVRANYGTGIMSNLFGTEVFMMPRHMNTLPGSKPVGDEDKIKEMIQKGVPDLNVSLGKKTFEMGEFFAEAFKNYPKIQKYVTVYHPDTQGPLDVCELVWGSEMFYAMYDSAETMHDFLSLITDTYITFMDKWYKMFPQEREWALHWGGIAYKGKPLIRNDSAMNLSPDLYTEFAKPYDQKILNHFGGGAIHFCGRGDHYIETMSGMTNLNAINMSQPHLNDMDTIFKHTIDKDIQILGLNRNWLAENDPRKGDYKHNISI